MISPFSEERFPIDLAFGSSGGPERQTEIVTLGSGLEERNQRWRRSRRRYEAGYGIKTLDELQVVVAFFEARRGQLQAFRFRDPLDWKSGLPGEVPRQEDQTIGTGDGTETRFTLHKQYGTGEDAYIRRIHKPVLGSTIVAVDGTIDPTVKVDSTTGELVFPAAPQRDAVITAGFAFDIPVRFDVDRLAVNLAAFGAGEVPSIPLLEVLL